DVLATGQFWVKARSHFEQRRHPPAQGDSARSRFSDTRQKLQQRGFSSPVSADDAENLPASDREGDLTQRPEFIAFLAGVAAATEPLPEPADSRTQSIAQRVMARLVPQHVALRQVLHGDCRVVAHV